MNANASAFVPRQRKVSDDLPDLPEAEDLFELTVEEELEELGMELGGMRSPYNNVEGNEMNGAAMMSGRTPPHMHQHQQQHPPTWSPKEAVNYHHPHPHLHHHQSQFQYQNQNQNFENIDVSNHNNNQGLMGLAMAMGRSYYGSSCNGGIVGGAVAPAAAENHHVISNGSSAAVENLSSSNGHHHQHTVVAQPSEGIQMLQKEFPSYSPESLADILEANDNDVSVTIDVLTQLELETDYSKTIKLQPVAPALNDINFPELS